MNIYLCGDITSASTVTNSGLSGVRTFIPLLKETVPLSLWFLSTEKANVIFKAYTTDRRKKDFLRGSFQY